MNKSSLLWGILLFTLCTTHPSYAKKIGVPDCNRKIDVAKGLLDRVDTLDEETLRAIIDWITPCVAPGNIDANYVNSQLLLEISLNQIELEQAISAMQQSAENGSIDAQRYLGRIYKTGDKVDANYSNSLFWFQKAADQGDEFSKYAVGYFQLKGFGDEDQNYQNALQSFGNSSYPMARHWEGICNYGGYGVSQDKPKGLDILKINNIVNSQELYDYLKAGSDELIGRPWVFNRAKDLDFIEHYNTDIGEITIEEFLERAGSARIIEFDWSGTKVKRAIHAQFELSYDYTTNIISYGAVLHEERQSFSGEASFADNTLDLDSFSFNARLIYPDYIEEGIYQYGRYDFSKIVFDEVTSTIDPSKKAFVGKITGRIDKYNEPLPPTYMVITKGGSLSRNSISLTKTLNKELSPVLTKPTITATSPNPFTNSFTVRYGVLDQSTVQLRVYNQLGNLVFETNQRKKEKGIHSESFDGSKFPIGIYVVHLIVNEQVQDRFTIIKK